MHGRAVLAGGAGVRDRAGLVNAPFVACPDWDVASAGFRGSGAEVQRQPSRLPAVAVEQSNTAGRRLDCLPEKLCSLGAHAGRVVRKPLPSIAELRLPVAALAGLQTVLVVQPQQHARLHESVQEAGQSTTQFGTVCGQVPYEQVGQRLVGSADTDVGARLPRELADEENECARPGTEPTVVRAVLLILDGLVELAKQHAGLEQVGCDLVEQKIRRHDGPQRIACRAANGVVDDAELRSELPDRTRPIDGAQSMLPETAADRQQWVVLHQDRSILATRRDSGVDQMPVDLTGVHFEHRPDRTCTVGTLGENDPPSNRFHVVVRQLHVEGEPALQSLQGRGAGQRRLPRAHEEQAVAESLAAGFHDLLHDVGAVRVVADVLLYLVEGDEGARQFPVRSEDILQGGNELLRCDVGATRKLLAQYCPHLTRAGRKVRVCR